MERMTLFAMFAALTLGSVTGYWSGGGNAAADSRGKLLPPSQLSPAEETPMVLSDGQRINLAETSRTSEALDDILADKLGSRRSVALDRYCATLDVAGIRSALESLKRDGSDETSEAISVLMGRWAELEPTSAAQYAREIQDQRLRVSALSKVLGVWVHLDAKAATEFVLSSRDPTFLSEALYDFSADLAERDPSQALRFADAFPLSHKVTVHWATFRTLAESNPASAAAQALGMPAGDLREKAVGAVLSIWVNKDPQTALAWLKGQKGLNRDELFRDAVWAWRDADAEAAANYVRDMPAGTQRDDLVRLIASQWSFRDAGRSMKWVQELPEDSAKVRALETVVQRWAWNDPQAAADFITKQSPGQSTDKMLQGLGSIWGPSDPENALAWALAHPSAEVEKYVTAHALAKVATENPARAVAALDQLQSPEARKEAVNAIAKSWSRTDPQEAMRWAMSLPDSKVADETLGRWTQQDPTAVGSWLNTMEGGARRDSLVASYARNLKYYDSEAAATWASTVTDANKRRTLVRSLVKDMAWYDADGALRWIQAQSLDASERQALLEQVNAVTKKK